MLYLLHEHPAALYADWHTTYGMRLHAYTMQDWRNDAHSDMSNLLMWHMTREILKNHHSHSFAAIAGYSWIPTDADVISWALSAHTQTDMPPWCSTDPIGNHAMRPTQAQQRADRAKLQAMFNIKE